MANNRIYLPIQQLDLEQILREANNRWLRPIEICEILRNYKKFYLTPDPPVRPPAASLFLFDRKALRYFRKDGHRWRKKKDGKTLREAHEKLKAGSVDVLHCYYAHGEDNESFQRRSYWMLDQHLEHIVLVHYREVKEGYKFGISRLLNSDPTTNIVVSQVSSEPCSAKSYFVSHTDQKYLASSPITSHWTRQALSSEFDDGDSGDDLETSSFTQYVYERSLKNPSFSEQETAGSSEISKSPLNSEFGATFTHGAYSPLWPQIHNSEISTSEKNFNLGHQGGSDKVACKFIDTGMNANEMVQDVTSSGSKPISDNQFNAFSANYQICDEVPNDLDLDMTHNQHEIVQRNDGSMELKNLDSFGRWMDKEIGVDCVDSLMTSNSGQYWNTINAQNADKEVSDLSCQIMLGMDSLSPLLQEQLFSICDFSPDWAYAGVETKVLICGKFLGNSEHSVGTKWCCMFGDIEVPAEVLTSNSIRCHAPTHSSGRVPFYITCCNRLACSEVREFEYRKNLPQDNYCLAITSSPEDELQIQIRLAKFLYYGGLDRRLVDCSLENCDKCKIVNHIIAIKQDKRDEWERIEGSTVVVNAGKQNLRDALIQKLLIDRLIEWLICKLHEGGKGPNILDEEGQGVIHLTAALGYELAMEPIIAAHVSPNFRDAHGRTGLHWASFFGREEAVLELVRLGADPGAVDDPTLKFPGGQTAADLASSRGHKGIAGYLAEAHLNRQVASLTINKIANKNYVRVLLQSNNNIDEQLSMKGSLMAVQNSSHAAALIQDSFRTRSFRHKQLIKNKSEISEVSLDLVALGSLNKVHKMHHYSDYLHMSAIKIQQKYRGWKGRNEFLRIRNRIVKIQAHVRGYQVRKQYKKVIWSVSIVEKVILRWRRKGSGLRGFRVDETRTNELHDTEKADDYEFLRIGRKQKFAGVENALSRVQSMSRHPEARNQYMRLLAKFDNKMCHKSQLAETAKENLEVQQDKLPNASN